MKLISVSSLLLAMMLAASTTQAGVNMASTHGILNSQEKCAAALNSYLSFRHATDSSDDYKIQKLERQVDSMCDGYQIKLVDNNGTMTGVIELAN